MLYTRNMRHPPPNTGSVYSAKSTAYINYSIQQINVSNNLHIGK